MAELKRVIATNITELRKAYPLTQAELAEKLNYSDKSVSKWERGESIPDVIVLKQIADLFGVTVDYMLAETHDRASVSESIPNRQKKNRRIITGLSCMLSVLIATVAFVILNLATDVSFSWLVFVWCVPICSILLIVFTSVWGKPTHNYTYISVLTWSLLACIYLTIGDWNNWLIFVIGIPAQIIICMWSGLKTMLVRDKNKVLDA